MRIDPRPAMQRVERVLNDRKGYHVDVLDDEVRDDLVGAIVEAANKEALDRVEQPDSAAMFMERERRLRDAVDRLRAARGAKK